MTTTDLARTPPEPGSALVLQSDQDFWTPAQLAALAHIGIENAPQGDLQVFHHVSQRTGLDPFARQIYMIARNGRELVDGNWRSVVKWTIQTGIDGFRLIGRRAADRTGETISVSAPEWAHEDGTWRPVWRAGWGVPVAARVTIHRAEQPFTAVALFDEYAQTKRDGDLTTMWAQRPAGQLAKCAEALAWRMAFPHDLSGLYAEEEMGQADNVPRGPARQARRTGGLRGALAQQRAATATERTPPAPAPESPPLDVRSDLARRMFAAFNDAGITDAGRLQYVSDVLGRAVTSSKEMTEADAIAVLAALDADNAPQTPDPHPAGPTATAKTPNTVDAVLVEPEPGNQS